jgi:DNA segregation ATPase FtsK/SpoIIIE, S-DNA-T family
LFIILLPLKLVIVGGLMYPWYMDKSTLEDIFKQFKLEAEVVGIRQGPAVERYEIKLGDGVRLKSLESLLDDISRLTGEENVNLISPLSRGLVGLEFPRKQRQTLYFWEELEDNRDDLTAPLSVFMGRDMDNKLVTADLSKMPHLLVAGATGSGKSVFINTVLCSILERMDPAYVRMVLIDPKQVELKPYESIPHLVRPIVTDPHEAGNALKYVVDEMDGRYELLAKHGVRNIAEFNAGVKAGKIDHDELPLWLVVIDELADLMMVAKREVESHIVRITQLARAAGIHLIVATQRPSVDVITGLIKANMPSRLAFAVSSKTDSRVILDQMGAEALTGMGDSLFVPQGAKSPIRLQALYTEPDDVQMAVGFWDGVKPEEDAIVLNPLLVNAVRETVNTVKYISTYMVERMFDVDYKTAQAIVKEITNESSRT